MKWRESFENLQGEGGRRVQKGWEPPLNRVFREGIQLRYLLT